jgi:hypothetical protein
MPRCSLSILLLAGLALPAQDRRFEPRPAAAYAQRQTAEGVTIGLELFQGKNKIKQAFPKTDLDKLGVVPVLVVIANDNDHALQLDRLQVQLLTGDRRQIDPIPADDVLRPARVQRPDLTPVPSPIPGIGRRSRRPTDTTEVAEREFVAPVVAARSSAYGFFYFRFGRSPDRLAGAKLILSGIRNAKTGQELLYFEIPADR